MMMFVFCSCFVMFFLCSVFVIVLFFFKQKTAYEMRISDWSSDVCSSDLNWTFGSAVGANDPNNDGANQFSVSIDGSPAVSSEVTLDKNVTIDSLVVDENDSLEIGRASCRERVCQYV